MRKFLQLIRGGGFHRVCTCMGMPGEVATSTGEDEAVRIYEGLTPRMVLVQVEFMADVSGNMILSSCSRRLVPLVTLHPT